MKAIGQFAGGINAYNAGKYTRSMMAVNATNTLNAGLSERQQIRDRAGMVMGQQMTSEGSSGFQTGTGTALDLLKQSAMNRELDLATSRMRSSNQAQDFAQKGFMAYQQGKSAEAGGIISGAGTIAEEVAGAVAGVPGGGGGGAAFGGAGSFGGVSDTNFDGITAPIIGAPDFSGGGTMPSFSDMGWSN